MQYLGLTQALRLSQPKFMEQFRRMLMSKLRVVFENASAELELWNKSASAQVDAQLRERRRGFRRRREALERIQAAASELETRLAELEAQDQRLQGFQARCVELADALRQQARTGTRGEMATMITHRPAARRRAAGAARMLRLRQGLTRPVPAVRRARLRARA